MARHGSKNQGGRRETAATSANAPQKKTSTQSGTKIFCAAASPNNFPNFKSRRSTEHCSIAWRGKAPALARAQSVARATHCKRDCPGRPLQSADAKNKG